MVKMSREGAISFAVFVVLCGGLATGIGFVVHQHLEGVWRRQRVAAAKEAAAVAQHEKACQPLEGALAQAEGIERSGDPQVGMVLVASAKYAGYTAGCLTPPMDVDQTGIDGVCQTAEEQDPTSIGGDEYGNPIQVPNPDYNPQLIEACIKWEQAELTYDVPSGGGDLSSVARPKFSYVVERG